ncbi:hypothetical protein ACJJI4_14515 [Microbulbifer sp. TRSA002]|uniref:hypothetical protein n=1 Tax=Microbulbifer sp. TRSA002 TaxID=3243382 RepID=UPI00403A74BC
MKRQVQILCFLISSLSLIGGLSDILIQFLDGEEIRWRIQLILIGVGVVLPTIIFPFYEPAPEKSNELDYDEEDLSKAYQDSPGFLSSSSREGSSDNHDESYDATD